MLLGGNEVRWAEWSSDPSKLGLLALCAVGLFAAARWASRFSEATPEQLPMAGLLAPVVPINSQRPASGLLPLETDLGRIRIRNLYFASFDLVPGPPDPNVFCDELFVEFYDVVNDEGWQQSYFVATPLGLRELLAENQWSHAYADSVFLLRRYDLNEMRRAIIEHIRETQEIPSPERRLSEQPPMI